jgi:hypothetical protein
MMDTVARTRSRFRIRITDMHQERPPYVHFFPLNGGISLLMIFYPSWQSIKSVAW